MKKEPTLRDYAVKKAYLSGKSLETVGIEFGVTRERIRQILAAQGCTERHSGVNEPRRIKARILKEAALARSKAFRERVSMLRLKVRTLYNAGSTYKEIAAACDLAVPTVLQHVWASGGPTRNPNAGKMRRSKRTIAKVKARYCKGDSVVDIAKAFDYANPNCIRSLAYSKGWTRPR